MLEFLAQTTVEVSSDSLAGILRSFGISGPVVGLLSIFALTVRGIVKWAMPHLEDMARAWAVRQRSMADNQDKLTDKTIEIQTQGLESARLSLKNSEQVLEAVRAMQSQLGGICKKP